MEIVTGVGAIGLGLVFWNDGWWHWLLVGVGLLGLMPWFGAAAILRRAERDPSVLQTDPARGRERGRRALFVMLLFTLLVGGVIGYASGGWGGAAFVGALSGGSGLLGAWWYLRREEV